MCDKYSAILSSPVLSSGNASTREISGVTPARIPTSCSSNQVFVFSVTSRQEGRARGVGVFSGGRGRGRGTGDGEGQRQRVNIAKGQIGVE